MTHERKPAKLPQQNRRLSRFDRVVLLILLSLASLAGLLAWRGDQIGVQVVRVNPPDGATGVTSQTAVRITFDQEISDTELDNPLLTLSPPVTGTVRPEGATLVFLPATPLMPETDYMVTLKAGLESKEGRPLLEPITWQFRTGKPRILYIAPDEEEQDQVTVIPIKGGSPLRLTEEPTFVWNHTVSSDGQTVVYAALRENNGGDLWAVRPDGTQHRRLLACPNAICSDPSWSPDGRRLVYEKREVPHAGDTPAPPRLWWVDPISGETARVFQDGQQLGHSPRWSPDGQWLSFVSPGETGVRIYNLKDGRSHLIPSRMGEPAAWSPDSNTVLVTEVVFQGERVAIHLFRADLNSGNVVDLNGKAEVEVNSPTWSPDGKWIAYGRKVPRVAMGRQIWLMRSDGSQGRPLTTELEIDHGPPTWSPDGRYLLFQRSPLKDPSTQPGIWILEIATGKLQQVVAPGSQPRWLW